MEAFLAEDDHISPQHVGVWTDSAKNMHELSVFAIEIAVKINY